MKNKCLIGYSLYFVLAIVFKIMKKLEDKTVYFQPPGIKPQFCEAGMISETDPEYIWYYDEPCKILISEVKIIPKEDVIYDKKKRSYLVKSAL